jgi:MFS family permease
VAYHRDAVTWAVFGALFGFGILNAVLGPVLPYLRAELGLGYLGSRGRHHRGRGRGEPRGRRDATADDRGVVALEFVLSFWLASYLHDQVGLPTGRAASLVAVLYAAHLVGRIVTSRLARRIRPRPLIAAALVAVLLGTPALLSENVPWLVMVGVVVVVTGTGATFPLASALHVQESARGVDGAMGQTLTIAALAQVIGPLGVGVIAQVADLRVALLLVPGFALLAGLSLVRRTRPGPPGD